MKEIWWYEEEIPHAQAHVNKLATELRQARATLARLRMEHRTVRAELRRIVRKVTRESRTNGGGK